MSGGRPRRAPVDPARLAAYDVLVAVREDDAYANLVLPQLLRERRIEARDAAFATELVGGTLRGPRTYDAVVDHLRRPAARRTRPSATRFGSGAPAARDARPRPRRCHEHGRAGPVAGRSQAGRVHQRGMRRIAAHDLDAWMDLLDAAHAGAFLAPRLGGRRAAAALGRPDELEALLAADNQRPRVTLVARPGLSTVAELVGDLVSTSSTGGGSCRRWRSARVGRPRDDSRGPGGPGRGAGRGLPVGSPGPLPGPRRRRRRALARPVCRARRQGRAAGRARHRPGSEGAGQRASAAPGQAGGAGAAGDPGRRSGGGRNAAGLAGGHLRPRARGCALLRARGLASPSREPVAPPTRGPRGLVPLQRALLDSAADSVRPGGVVLYATCSPVVAETAGVVEAVLAGVATYGWRTTEAAGARGRGRRSQSTRGGGPALAAPSRHRRHVHGTAEAPRGRGGRGKRARLETT